MTLEEFIHKYASTTMPPPPIEITQRDYYIFFAQNDNLLIEEIDGLICHFFESLHTGAELTAADFEKFRKLLSAINNKQLKEILTDFIQAFVTDIFNFHRADIHSMIEQIRKQTSSHQSTPLKLLIELPEKLNVTQLLNLYALVRGNRSIFSKDIFYYEIPFAINVLMLANRTPKDYANIDLSLPLYPEPITVNKKELPLKKGIKPSSTVYPIFKSYKQFKGGSEDTVYQAIDLRHNKILFIRGDTFSSVSNKGKAESIIASKLAKFISPFHFSSERLLDNNQVASAALPQYAVPLSRLVTKEEAAPIRKHLAGNKVFPGTGIVEEVSAFFDDTDPNIENFALSSATLSESHITRIDFSACNLGQRLEKSAYLRNRKLSSMYQHSFDVKEYDLNEDFLNERRRAKLKLALLTPEFIAAVAEKAFLEPTVTIEREPMVQEVARRADMALECFCEDPQAIRFLLLQQSSNIFEQLKKESYAYIARHFTEEQRKPIIESIEQRLIVIKSAIARIAKRPLQESPGEQNTPKPLVNEETVTLVLQAYNQYIANRAPGNWLNFFRNTKLTVMKRCLAKSLSDTLRDLPQKTIDDFKKYNHVGIILNYILEKLSHQKNEAFQTIQLSDEKITKLFNGIIKQAASGNLDLASLDKQDIPQNFVQAILMRLAPYIGTSRLPPAAGKPYACFFSSGFVRATQNIQSTPQPSCLISARLQ